MLGSGVSRAALVDAVARGRRDGDDDAISALDKLGKKCPRHSQRPQDVDVVHALPVVRARRCDRVESERTACVVDENPAGVEVRSKSLRACGIGHVEANGSATGLVGECLEPVSPARRRHDLETLGHQPADGCRPDATAGTGHDRNP